VEGDVRRVEQAGFIPQPTHELEPAGCRVEAPDAQELGRQGLPKRPVIGEHPACEAVVSQDGRLVGGVAVGRPLQADPRLMGRLLQVAPGGQPAVDLLEDRLLAEEWAELRLDIR
jgi:hypothetical protein